ncbi:RagB/SusD family nutrient uptake outer membrane protein [Danxiaibacter flavus]|uniref:RagB/SusD family nutrient uptake outer membrane protein n=1 Tax=Danxiaibacter flavus TaxID=3049108 RepID=A0ABV3ZNE1_9BACT|nr:RagB/SusD family nutrient uptake outer membrane protein [Chitinophagaceae bacterium DXS]
MKSNISYIALSILLLMGCKKEAFLDRYPMDALSEPTYFKNENDLKLFCNTLYTTLPEQSFPGDVNSDIMVPKSKFAFWADQYVVPVSGGFWSSSDWATIRSCNYFLSRYKVADASNDVKSKYAAEARFFRAHSYWGKVKLFGDVPWMGSYIVDTSYLLYAKRDPRKMVMDSVLSDLNFAINNLPLPEKAESGRLHKYAAMALKARICLWEGTHRRYFGEGDDVVYLQEAASNAEAIRSAGLYDVYSTGNPDKDYYNLFIQQELLNNKEAIFPMRYLKDVRMNNISRALGETNCGYSKSFVRSYLCTDGLPISLSHLYKGDDSLDAECINRDPRFKQTIATRGFVFLVNTDGSKDTISLPRIGTAVTSTGYQTIKGRSSDIATWNANQSVLDFFVFRYAEILLIEAEAKAELNTCTQAVIDNTINKLRKRVGMPNMVIASLQKDPGSEFPALPVLLDEIRRERKIELAGDGFRSDDILRWKAGKLLENPESILGMKLLPQTIAQYKYDVSGMPLDKDSYIRVYTDIISRTWKDKLYLYPIPTQELTLNPNLLPQNPGW